MNNYEIMADLSKYKDFRGVFMKNELPKKVNENEIGVVNIGSSLIANQKNGTHWVGYVKKNNTSYYFDSYGLPIIKEIKKYLMPSSIVENTFRIQKASDGPICGPLTVFVIERIMKLKNITPQTYLKILLNIL